MDATQTQQDSNTQAVVLAALQLFMSDGEDHTIREIAEAMGWPEAKVRRAIASAPGGTPRELRYSESHRASYSRNYPGMQAGAHKVALYGPTREWLRELLLRAQG